MRRALRVFGAVQRQNDWMQLAEAIRAVHEEPN